MIEELAGQALELQIRTEVKSISKKYVEPPYTTVLNTLDQAQTRTNVMSRALRAVEALPETQAVGVLGGHQDEHPASGTEG